MVSTESTSPESSMVLLDCFQLEASYVIPITPLRVSSVMSPSHMVVAIAIDGLRTGQSLFSGNGEGLAGGKLR
jgi:hypothetical protein